MMVQTQRVDSCQRRSNIGPLGRSKISPLFYATRGVLGCPGSSWEGPVNLCRYLTREAGNTSKIGLKSAS